SGDRAHNVINRSRNDNAYRNLAIVGGIDRVHAATSCVKPDFAFDVPLQFEFESTDINFAGAKCVALLGFNNFFGWNQRNSAGGHFSSLQLVAPERAYV